MVGSAPTRGFSPPVLPLGTNEARKKLTKVLLQGYRLVDSSEERTRASRECRWGECGLEEAC